MPVELSISFECYTPAKVCFYKCKQGWSNLLLRARVFGHAKKTDAQNQAQCARLIEKQLKAVFFLLPKSLIEFVVFIFIVISSKVFAIRLLQC